MTTDTLRQITGVLRTPKGSAFPNKTLTWFRERRVVQAQGSSVVLDEPFYVVTDGAGAIDHDVMAGNYLVLVRLKDTDRYFRVSVPDQAGPFNIADLVDAPPVTPEIITQVQALMIEARAWAENPEDIEVASGQFSSLHHARKSAASAGAAALYDGPWLDNVAALLADTALTYTAAQPGTVTAGKIVRTRAEGFAYRVAASGASDHHVTTAGGVKLYVIPQFGAYSVRAFGAVGDGVSDDFAAIAKCRDVAQAPATIGNIVFPRGTYRIMQPLAFSGVNVDFGNSIISYAGAVGFFALTLNSNAGASNDQLAGNIFENLTLAQSDFTPFTTVTGSAVYDPPSIAGGSAISNISPGGVTTTVSVPGATVGGYARATFTSIAPGIEITAWVSAPGVVSVTFSNYGAGAADMASGTINVTVVNNAYHGLCLGGVLGRLRNAKVRGFTGVSVGWGDGRDVTSGVVFPSASGRAYYWRAEVNVASAAGWNMIVPPRNNENEISISTFPLNAYNDATPRRANSISQLVIGGLTNTFPKLSFEANSSEATMVLLPSANGNSSPAVGYIEYNASYAVPPFPRILAKRASSANSFRFRHPYSGKTISDLGSANDLAVVPSFFVNGQQSMAPRLSRNLMVNGDFSNGTVGWSNFSSGSTLSVTGSGVYTGRRVRLDLVSGRPNLQQDLHTVGGFIVAGLGGQNVTCGAWIKTNIGGVKVRVSGETGNTGTVGDETDEFITATVLVLPGTTTLPVSIITDASGLTGYVEISNVTAVVGLVPLAFGERPQPVGSATYNPPSLTNGSRTTTTVSVPGAALGDHVVGISFSNDLQGIRAWGYVSAADTVTVVFENNTGGTLDLGSGTLRALVQKA